MSGKQVWVAADKSILPWSSKPTTNLPTPPYSPPSSESWTSPLIGVPPWVLTCSRVNYYFMTRQGWEQQVENNWTDTKRLDKALHPHLGGREPGERRVPTGSSRRKRKITPSKIWKMPKTKFLDFQISFLDLAQGWVPGTFFFIYN